MANATPAPSPTEIIETFGKGGADPCSAAVHAGRPAAGGGSAGHLPALAGQARRQGAPRLDEADILRFAAGARMIGEGEADGSWAQPELWAKGVAQRGAAGSLFSAAPLV